MTESTGTFSIYFSSPTEIEHSELLTSSLLNELHSFEMLAVINFNLLSHKLLSLNNHWSCFKSFENIVSEFTPVGHPPAGNWNKAHLNTTKWGGKKITEEELNAYSFTQSKSPMFCNFVTLTKAQSIEKKNVTGDWFVSNLFVLCHLLPSQ